MLIIKGHRLGVASDIRVHASKGEIGLTSEIIQEVVHQDAIMRQWRLIQKTRRAQVQPGLGSARVSSSIRQEYCDHILQDVRIEWLDTDCPSSFLEAVYMSVIRQNVQKERWVVLSKHDLVSVNDSVVDVRLEWAAKGWFCFGESSRKIE